MASSNNFSVYLDAAPDGPPAHAFFFGEDQARYLVATDAPDAIQKLAARIDVPVQTVGRTKSAENAPPSLTIGAEPPISLADLRDAHESWLPRYMAG